MPMAIPLSAYIYVVAYRRDLLATGWLGWRHRFCHSADASKKLFADWRSSNATEHAWLMPVCALSRSMILSIWRLPGSGVLAVT